MPEDDRSIKHKWNIYSDTMAFIHVTLTEQDNSCM